MHALLYNCVEILPSYYLFYFFNQILVYKSPNQPSHLKSFISQVSASDFQCEPLIFTEQCASLTQNACCRRIVSAFLRLVNKSANILSLHFVLFPFFGFVIFTNIRRLNEVRFRFAGGCRRSANVY